MVEGVCRMGRLRFVVTPVAIVIFLAVSFAGCKPSPGENAATPTLMPTPPVPSKPTYVVQRGQVVDQLEFNGRVAPIAEQELFFRTDGYVGAVYVERDDWVREGDVLAILEVTDLQNQLALARAELDALEANAARQTVEAEAALRVAELRLAQARVNDPSPAVTIAQVGVEQAQIALANIQEEYQKALDRPWEPEEVREGLAAAVHQAELNLAVAQAQLQQAIQARDAHLYDLQILQQEVNVARARLEELQAGADVEAARLNVQRLEGLLADASLIAPMDGRVLSLNISPGRSVRAYNPVMVIADMSELEVSANLSQEEMEQLAEGMPATIVLMNRPGEEIPGQVRLLPYPYGGGGRSSAGGFQESDRSTRVSFARDVSGLNLQLGAAVRVTVVLERKDDVLWLPPQAIRTFGGRRFVVIQEEGGQRIVDVTIGIEGDERVEIVDGLMEGQVVVGP